MTYPNTSQGQPQSSWIKIRRGEGSKEASGVCWLDCRGAADIRRHKSLCFLSALLIAHTSPTLNFNSAARPILICRLCYIQSLVFITVNTCALCFLYWTFDFDSSWKIHVLWCFIYSYISILRWKRNYCWVVNIREALNLTVTLFLSRFMFTSLFALCTALSLQLFTTRPTKWEERVCKIAIIPKRK